MKNVREFTITDPEMAALKPETIATWKTLMSDHWKLFQIENVYVFSTRKDFTRRRLHSIYELESLLPAHAQVFKSLKAFEDSLKLRVAYWYDDRTYELYEPYEDILRKEFHIDPKPVLLSDVLPFDLGFYLEREVFGWMSEEEMASWSMEEARKVAHDIKANKGIDADPKEVFDTVADCIAEYEEENGDEE